MRASTASMNRDASRAQSWRPPAGRMQGASSSISPGSAKAPIAIEAVKRIDVLFAIEREINGMTPRKSGSTSVTSAAGRSIAEFEAWLRATCQALRQERDRQGDPLQPQALDRAHALP